MKSKVRELARELIEHGTQNGVPVRIMDKEVTSNKPDTLSQMIRTKEAADIFRRMLKSYIDYPPK